MPYPDHRKKASGHCQILLSAIAVACVLFFWFSLGKSSSLPDMGAIKQPITIISLSQNRSIARAIGEHVRAHSYHLGGVLASDPFSASELALVLHTIEPPPRAVVIGRGYSKSEADEARKILAEYVQNTGTAPGTVVKISDEVFQKVGKEGIPAWVLQQLQDYFEKN